MKLNEMPMGLVELLIIAPVGESIPMFVSSEEGAII